MVDAKKLMEYMKVCDYFRSRSIWKHRLLHGEKVTTRSQVSVYRTNDPMKTISAIDR